METEVKKRIIDWNHVYLLGWFGRDRRAYLTTWVGKRPDITVIVTGPDILEWGPPIWDAPANCKPNASGIPHHPYTDYQLHEVKEGEDSDAKAIELGGVKAIGWYFPDSFERKWPAEK